MIRCILAGGPADGLELMIAALLPPYILNGKIPAADTSQP